MSPAEAPADVAVIDIGSNSVRLVVYRLEGRAIWTSYNEKVLAGLGRGLAESGRLSRGGRQAALSALRRFRAVLNGARVERIFVAATAAMREATDGLAFAAEIKANTGFDVRILEGAQEAYYAALGVRAGQPGASGVVGDLGGSSLELVRVDAHPQVAGVTLPLGPFAMRASARGAADLDATRRACAAELSRVSTTFRAPVLHAVGGAWRSLALLQMRMCDYPLEIVHEYEISALDALDVARFVSRQSRGSLERIPGVSRKRADTLPHAAIVLEQLVEHLQVRRVSMSAYGLREGLLLEAMAPATRVADPLIAGCQAFGERQGMAEALGSALEVWMQPLWNALPAAFPLERQAVILAAACRLADVGARLHPDHRADLAYEQVLRAPIAGQNHAERVFLALAVSCRYAGTVEGRDPRLGRIVSEAQVRAARALGAALRLACDLCGRNAALLGRARAVAREQRGGPRHLERRGRPPPRRADAQAAGGGRRRAGARGEGAGRLRRERARDPQRARVGRAREPGGPGRDVRARTTGFAAGP